MLQRHPRAEVAFYTSMRESNALPAVQFIARQSGGSVDANCCIYDREYNKADNQRKGAKDWDTARDLPRIWGTEGRVGYGFTIQNTIMVDDTVRKMRDYPHNVLVVPEFKDQRQRADGSMRALREYLSRLLDFSPADVRTHIAGQPFQAGP